MPIDKLRLRRVINNSTYLDTDNLPTHRQNLMSNANQNHNQNANQNQNPVPAAVVPPEV